MIDSLFTSDDERTGDLDVTASIPIVGPGPGLLNVDGNRRNRILHVHGHLVRPLLDEGLQHHERRRIPMGTSR